MSPAPTPNGIASAVSSSRLSVTIATAPVTNDSPIPGTKWWMWLSPTLTSPSGHQPARIPAVESRAQPKAPTKPEKRLNSAVSRREAAL